MATRTRNNRLEIKLSDEEMKFFREKMRKSNSKSMAHFIRKCVLEKDIFVVELTPFRRLQSLLSNSLITTKKNVRKGSRKLWQSQKFIQLNLRLTLQLNILPTVIKLIMKF